MEYELESSDGSQTVRIILKPVKRRSRPVDEATKQKAERLKNVKYLVKGAKEPDDAEGLVNAAHNRTKDKEKRSERVPAWPGWEQYAKRQAFFEQAIRERAGIEYSIQA